MSIDQLKKALPLLEAKLGHTFYDKDLLLTAFLHRSYLNEHKEIILNHNERLEFLGDTVLGLIASELLYLRFPHYKEGDLSFLRSRLVDANSCVAYLKTLDLDAYILLGKGERMNDGRGRDSILADLFEALIGAIYLDGGYEPSKRFFLDHFTSEIEAIIETPVSNYKALLQDYAQKNFQQQPLYQVLKEEGPDHSKLFEVAVLVNDQILGIGTGSSKKEAQQEAARSAVEKIDENKNTI
jgi:ribonuclease-3